MSISEEKAKLPRARAKQAPPADMPQPVSALATVAPIKTGRPRKFTDADDLQQAIDAYFNAQDAAEKPYTMAGLARAVGCCTATLRNYSENGPDRPEFIVDRAFMEAIKGARQRVEQWTEERLFSAHAIGPIFSLKNNFGWKDVQIVEASVKAVVLGVDLTDEARLAMSELLLSAVQGRLSPPEDV